FADASRVDGTGFAGRSTAGVARVVHRTVVCHLHAAGGRDGRADGAADGVGGVLLGAALQTVVSHPRLHRFFSVNRWSADALGLVLARLIVERLLPGGAALEVAVDDTLCSRRAREG